MNKLVAVVPIRKGSQRVKHKNLKPFGGKNLLIHKIEPCFMSSVEFTINE